MISFRKVDENEISSWNEKLTHYNASFFQYPYYASGNNEMPFSKSKYYLISQGNEELAFIAMHVIQFFFFKIGLITRGPAVLKENCEKEILEGIKDIQKKERYIFVRINPNLFDKEFEACMIRDKNVYAEDFFPLFRGSQDRDFIIPCNSEEEALLRHYKSRARQKIKYAGQETFNFFKSSDISVLRKVYDMFLHLADEKGFKFRSYKSYEKILSEGQKYNLASLYCCEDKNGKLVNSAIILKDKNSFYYMSGALAEGDYNPRNAPATKLHHKIIIDCGKEGKKFYNISYTNKESPVHTFKSSFNPKEVIYPDHYTITRSYIFLKRMKNLVEYYKTPLKRILRARYGNK